MRTFLKDNTEIWKDIQGYEDIYQVSNFGKVKSLDRKIFENHRHGTLCRNLKGRLLKSKSHNGYELINLSKHGKVRTLAIHRLVASSFISNPNKFPEVNHKDSVKNNNVVSNLEWCTELMNMEHHFKQKRGKNEDSYYRRFAYRRSIYS